MAALPPRKNATPVKICKQHLSPLQVLLQMGFPKLRAEKALAATGHRGVQLASDWLLAHVNDTTMDLHCPREYVLYLCPTGTLNDHVESFWNDSLRKCGWNAAHNLVPHITLCPFFMCPDEKCENLVSTLKELVQDFLSTNKFPPSLTLDKYHSPNYMGLFLNDVEAEILQNFARQYVQEISHDTVRASTESSRKELHLTLAYSFSSSHYATLDTLASAIDRTARAGWEVRLYSRDTRIIGNEVHRVLYSHVPREPDELELLNGDFVYVNREVLTNSLDGWVDGTSWLTGCQGYVPVNYIEKTAESDAWTLHCAMAIIGNSLSNDGLEGPILFPRRPKISLSLLNLLENSEGSRRSCELFSDSSLEKLHSRQASADQNQPETNPSHPGTNISQSGSNPSHPGVNLTQQELDSLYSKVKISSKKRDNKGEFSPVKPPIEGPRRLIVVRHGERVDFTFGDWIRFCFDENGKYLQKDLNMPSSLPKREGLPNCFYKDSPLTKVGLYQALLLGEGMKASKVEIHHVFCSPSFRCVQTCTNILRGLGLAQVLPLNIEPGLFEWLAWHVDSLPRFMTIEELKDADFNINGGYEPLIQTQELLGSPKETCDQFYARSAFVTQSILNQTKKDGGTVLMIGHAATVDTCCRQLIGGVPRSPHNLTTLLKKIPYCSFSYTVQDPQTGSWSLQDPPFDPVTHSANARYDWKALLQT